MPGKQSPQIFQKRHFDPERFIEAGVPPTESTPEVVMPVQRVPLDAQISQPISQSTEVRAPEYRPLTEVRDKPRKIAMTYKHKEQNYIRLKRLSQRLEITMGELIDEALEAKFADWKSRVPPDPEF